MECIKFAAHRFFKFKLVLKHGDIFVWYDMAVQRILWETLPLAGFVKFYLPITGQSLFKFEITVKIL